MFIGIDVGTSSIKSVLVDRSERLIASAQVSLIVSRPQPGFSEQAPEDWWHAALETLDQLHRTAPREMSAVTGIGFSGQMHGATLLDRNGDVLRPCILWNDGRAAEECREMEAACPDLHTVSGNLAMPGFTAPKLLWVRKHEPQIFAATDKVLLPKAYLRYRLSGEMIEDMSDAAGTLWLDGAKRDWSDKLLAVTGLTRAHMPKLAEGNAVAGKLKPELVKRWEMKQAPVFSAGAGDNAAGAVGLGAIHAGDAFISLGTSGVVWVTTERFAPNPASAVHAFCHAVPNMWHQMGVILSAASSLGWHAGIMGKSEAELLAELGDKPKAPSPVIFLPYLSGERTPHNDAAIRGVFCGLSHETRRADLTQAVLEGVAFAVKDCVAALAGAGTRMAAADVIGGGSRSAFWLSLMASVLAMPLSRLAESDVGAALGAARLGRMAATGESPADVCRKPARLDTFSPDPALAEAYAGSYQRYRALYPLLKGAA
ncbi:MAG TPA: xylulokinase [Dongiaceae bacterium]|nr:xylulokinase [Dongiaceae bacterium]